MLKIGPIKVLLADVEYAQYQLMKGILSNKKLFSAEVFWCGEPDQYLHAIQSGIYDLALVDHKVEPFFMLEQLQGNGCHTPVVMMIESLSDEMLLQMRQCGILDTLDRYRPDINSLRRCVRYADLYRNGELQPASISHFLAARSQVTTSQSASH